jgi:hypothetical protein
MPPPPPALNKDNPYLGFTKYSLSKKGVFSNFGPQHATDVSRILDDCLEDCATLSRELVNIGKSKFDADYNVRHKNAVVKDLTKTVQNLTDVIKFFNEYIKEYADFEKKMVDFRYVEDDREEENILRVVVCCRFLPISYRIEFVRAINGIANKETKKSIALFKYDDEDNAYECASFEEKLHKNNITGDSSAETEQLLRELAKLTVTDADLDVVRTAFLDNTSSDDDDTVTSDLSRPSTTSSSTDSSRPSTPSSTDSSRLSTTSFSSDSSRLSTPSGRVSPTPSGRVSPTSAGRVSPTSSGRVSPTSFDTSDYDVILNQKNKVKPTLKPITRKGILPFKGGKKKTRKQKRKRATRRRARR